MRETKIKLKNRTIIQAVTEPNRMPQYTDVAQHLTTTGYDLLTDGLDRDLYDAWNLVFERV